MRIRDIARPIWRRVRWILLTLLALELAYLVAGNAIVWFVLRQQVNKDADTKMSYGFAYSVWPTIVHVRDFRVSNHDSSVEWTLAIREADLSVDLFALAAKKFHARRIRAEGVTFHLRQRLDAAHADNPRSRMLPAVPPFADPPLAPFGPPIAPRTDATYNLWTAELEDIACGVDEVWIDGYRMVGKGRLTGAFFFKPLRMIVLQPTRAELDGVDLRIGEETLLHDVRGSVVMRIGAYDPRHDNSELARAFSANVHFGAQVSSLRAVNLLLGRGAPRLDDGSGELRIDAELDRGRLRIGSLVRYETDDARTRVAGLDVDAAGVVSLRAVRGGSDGRLEIDAALRRVALERGRVAPAVLAGRLALRGLDADLVGPHHPRGFFEGAIDMPDLTWLDVGAEAGAPLRVVGGSGRAEGRVDVDPHGIARANLRANATHAGVTFADVRARADVAAELHLDRGNLANKSARITQSFVEAQQLAIVRAGKRTSGWARVDVPALAIAEGELAEANADVDARVADVAALFGSRDSRAKLVVRSGAARAKAHLERDREGATRGAIAATVRDAVVSVPGSNVVANLSTRFEMTSPARDPLAIAVRRGKLMVSGLGVGRGGAAPADRSWWAAVDVAALDIRARSSLAVAFRGSARCLDGRAPLDVLVDAGEIPGWVATIFPADGLAGNAELRRDASGLFVRFGAAGGGAEAKGAFIDRGGGLDGEMIVEDGVLRAGVELRRGQPSFQLFAGEGWLRDRLNALATRR